MFRGTYRSRTVCLVLVVMVGLFVDAGAGRVSAAPRSYAARSYGSATTTTRLHASNTSSTRYDAALRRPGDAGIYGVTSPYVRYYSYGYGARRWPYHAWYSYPYARSSRYSFYGLNYRYGSYGLSYGIYQPWYSLYSPSGGFQGVPYSTASGLPFYSGPALPAQPALPNAAPGRHYGGSYYW